MAVGGDDAAASAALADRICAQMAALPQARPTLARAVQSGGGSARSSGVADDGRTARLREALPLTLRRLLDRGVLVAAEADAAARFLIDWRAGFLKGGVVSYAERVGGGGSWDEGRVLAGQDARDRVAAAMTAMRPLPGGCVKAVVVEEVSLLAAGSAAGYRDADQSRSYAVGLLKAGLDELVRFYA